MKKNQILRMIIALTLLLGIQGTASAQLRGLLKKAKKVLDIEVTTSESKKSNDNSINTTTDSPTNYSNENQSDKISLQLNPEVFIYQPVDDPVNAPLYDINNPKVKEYYEKWIALGNLPDNDEHFWLFEFFDYQSPTRGLKQVHVTEFTLSSTQMKLKVIDATFVRDVHMKSWP